MPHLPGPTGAPGGPKTRKEPLRAANGRMFPHPENTANMRTWRAIWMAAGGVRLEPPVVIEVYIRVARPPSHFNTRGHVNATGLKFSYPTKFDISNVIKLVEDALKGHAFGDDSEVISIHAHKRWVERGNDGTFVTILTAGGHDDSPS